MMWYGVLGTKELLHRTYKNLEQRVLLEVSGTGLGWEPRCQQQVSWACLPHFLSALMAAVLCCQCDGRPIPLPSLQGIAVLNIPSYAGGTNFWGGTKEDDVRTEPVSLLPSCLSVWLSSDHLSVPLRPSPLLPLTIRSWRWWPCSAACRWSCPASSTCSITASPRCSCRPPARPPSVRLSVRLANLLCPSVSDGEDHHPG